jgi:hypothetical protein
VYDFCALQSVVLSHVAPASSCKMIHDWKFPVSSIRTISLCNTDNRSFFLYVLDNADDFHVFFPSEGIRLYCYNLIVNMLEDSPECQDIEPPSAFNRSKKG